MVGVQLLQHGVHGVQLKGACPGEKLAWLNSRGALELDIPSF